MTVDDSWVVYSELERHSLEVAEILKLCCFFVNMG